MAPSSPTKSIGGGHKRTASSILKAFVGHRKQSSISELTDLAKATLPQPPKLPALDLDFGLAPPRAPFMNGYGYQSSGDLPLRTSTAGNTPVPGSPATKRGSFEFFSRTSIDDQIARKGTQKERGTTKKAHKAKSSIDFGILTSRQRKIKDKSEGAATLSSSKLQKDSKSSMKDAFLLRGTNKENMSPMRTSSSQPQLQLPTIPLSSTSSSSNQPFIPLPANHPHARRTQNPAPVERPPVSRPKSFHQSTSKQSVHDEISLYTPTAYTPSKQRDFGVEGPVLKQRPKSVYQTSAAPSLFGSQASRVEKQGYRMSMDISRPAVAPMAAPMGPPPLPPKDERPKTAKSRAVELEGTELDEAFERVLVGFLHTISTTFTNSLTGSQRYSP